MEVPALTAAELQDALPGESSAPVRERVCTARERVDAQAMAEALQYRAYEMRRFARG